MYYLAYSLGKYWRDNHWACKCNSLSRWQSSMSLCRILSRSNCTNKLSLSLTSALAFSSHLKKYCSIVLIFFFFGWCRGKGGDVDSLWGNIGDFGCMFLCCGYGWCEGSVDKRYHNRIFTGARSVPVFTIWLKPTSAMAIPVADWTPISEMTRVSKSVRHIFKTGPPPVRCTDLLAIAHFRLVLFFKSLHTFPWTPPL